MAVKKFDNNRASCPWFGTPLSCTHHRERDACQGVGETNPPPGATDDSRLR